MKKKITPNSNNGVPLQGLEVNMFYESSPIIFANAKKLRNEPASSELIFWNLLNNTFQILDLKGNIRLVFITLKEVKNNDKLRDEFMQSLSLKIVRFTNDKVCKNGDNIVKKLKEIIESLTINKISL